MTGADNQQERLSVATRSAERCGNAGSSGWYWEVSRLADIQAWIIPFFRRFPLVGWKAEDFELFARAAELLGSHCMSDEEYRDVLLLREQMKRGGKRRYMMERILRDYTPSSPADVSAR